MLGFETAEPYQGPLSMHLLTRRMLVTGTCTIGAVRALAGVRQQAEIRGLSNANSWRLAARDMQWRNLRDSFDC